MTAKPSLGGSKLPVPASSEISQDFDLARLPSQITSFEEFANAYPNGQVLSRDTGYRRNYGDNPYRGYDDINNVPFLLSDPADPRLPAMERVLNISVNDKHRVYPFSAFNDEPVINDKFNGVPVVVFSKGRCCLST